MRFTKIKRQVVCAKIWLIPMDMETAELTLLVTNGVTFLSLQGAMIYAIVQEIQEKKYQWMLATGEVPIKFINTSYRHAFKGTTIKKLHYQLVCFCNVSEPIPTTFEPIVTTVTNTLTTSPPGNMVKQTLKLHCFLQCY